MTQSWCSPSVFGMPSPQSGPLNFSWCPEQWQNLIALKQCELSPPLTQIPGQMFLAGQLFIGGSALSGRGLAVG